MGTILNIAGFSVGFALAGQFDNHSLGIAAPLLTAFACGFVLLTAHARLRHAGAVQGHKAGAHTMRLVD